MKMLVFVGVNKGDFPGIVFVPDVSMPTHCGQCAHPIQSHACECRKAMLHYCVACVSWLALDHTKRIIGHSDCEAPLPRPRHGDSPRPGLYVGEPPLRPRGWPAYPFERLLDHGSHPHSPPWLTEKEFAKAHRLDSKSLNELAANGAVNVTHCRGNPTWDGWSNRWWWPFDTFYLPGNVEQIKAAAKAIVDKAAVKAERRRKRDAEREIDMDEWLKQREEREKLSLTYRHGIAERAQFYGLHTGIESGVFGDGCRLVKLPSLDDYDGGVHFEANFREPELGRLALIEKIAGEQ